MFDSIPDNIPKNLIKERKYWHSDGSHEINQLNLTPERYHAGIPYRFETRICLGGPGHEGSSFYRRVPVCGTCRKPFMWFLHYCMLCGDLFIRDFGDPRYCDLYPSCWNCLPLLGWEFCPDHSSLYTGNSDPANPRNGFLPFKPVGLNPRTFTDEELENVFDF